MIKNVLRKDVALFVGECHLILYTKTIWKNEIPAHQPTTSLKRLWQAKYQNNFLLNIWNEALLVKFMQLKQYPYKILQQNP